MTNPDAFLAELRSRLPELKLLTDEVDRESYRRDETAHFEPGLPLAVALPETTEQVAAVMRLASKHRVPVVPRGAGTGLSGGSAGIDGALTLVLTRMNRILEVDRDNLVAVVQPGVINADLKAEVAKVNLFYPPDPASYEMCSIGGNIGTNAGGLCCVKYGVTRDAVLSLEVVLADGRVIHTGGRNVKDVAGYSLTHLFVGSQGTLGIVTEATLRLRPAPPSKQTLLAFFPSIEASGAAVAAMTAAGLEPCTLELMDRVTIAAVDDWHHLGLDRSAAALLLIESDRPGEAATAELERAASACTDAGASSVVRATNAMEADWLRQVRRLAFRAMERLGVARMEDVGAPRSRLPELIRAIDRVAARHDVRCGTFGHVGDGNLHPTFVWDRGDAAAEERAQAACEELYREAIALGGTVTGEHGIGAARKAFLAEQRGEEAVAVMRSIKRALDSLNILNPGRVV
ncbi:MAG TPA: FAD-linked oxidase C-terminal domain-containing protein [candidate division Zixibacteria bacterium]|nr:FAD-linked oxidase C-terminal domain-containing protein [candidate division Zixibacteria bacterium]